MKELLKEWKADKLWGALSASWLLTVAFAFENGGLFLLELPYVGAFFGYRVFLFVATVLFAAWAIKTKQRFWRDVTTIERWTYAFIAVMLLYGALSLPRAISFDRSFRMLFNLTLDMAFFFLALRLCREEKLRRATLWLCTICLLIIIVLGIYEVFCGGMVNTYYNNYKRFQWLNSYFQFPVVFYGNTNDYAEYICFITGILVLDARYWKRENAFYGGAMTFIMAAVFLLTLAASARLCLTAYVILLGGWTLFSLLRGYKGRRQTAIVLLAVCCICFCNQYRDVVYPITAYLKQAKLYYEQMAESKGKTETLEKPKLIIGNPNKETLAEQFFEEDVETGEIAVRETRSAGVRLRLLIHCLKCFKESKALGVGLGNTGQLAVRYQVAQRPTGDYYESIHCFIARVIADYGMFALIPLAAIGFLLMRGIWRIFSMGLKHRSLETVAVAVLVLAVLSTYPFLSTASSDAQDSTAMWLYLAMLIILCSQIDEQYERQKREVGQCPELSLLLL